MLQNDKINCNGSFRDITMYFVKDPCVNVSILWIIIMYHVKFSRCSTSKIHWDMSNFLVHSEASCSRVMARQGSGSNLPFLAQCGDIVSALPSLTPPKPNRKNILTSACTFPEGKLCPVPLLLCPSPCLPVATSAQLLSHGTHLY